MSELHNTSPLNHMESHGVAKLLVWGEMGAKEET